jgi:hypothetical protein
MQALASKQATFAFAESAAAHMQYAEGEAVITAPYQKYGLAASRAGGGQQTGSKCMLVLAWPCLSR